MADVSLTALIEKKFNNNKNGYIYPNFQIFFQPILPKILCQIHTLKLFKDSASRKQSIMFYRASHNRHSFLRFKFRTNHSEILPTNFSRDGVPTVAYTSKSEWKQCGPDQMVSLEVSLHFHLMLLLFQSSGFV